MYVWERIVKYTATEELIPGPSCGHILFPSLAKASQDGSFKDLLARGRILF